MTSDGFSLLLQRGEVNVLSKFFLNYFVLFVYFVEFWRTNLRPPACLFFAGGPLSASKRKKVIYTADFRLYSILSTLTKPLRHP